MFLTILVAYLGSGTAATAATAAVVGGATSIPGRLASETIKSLTSGTISEPARGSVLYSAILTSVAEHSGIYIGDGQIVHLNGDGNIEAVSAMTFLNRLGGFATGISLFASCDQNGPVGCNDVAERAISMIGETRNYGLLTDNCHQFSAGCLTGDFENSSNFLWMLKDQASTTLSATHWASWDFDSEQEDRRFECAAPALAKQRRKHENAVEKGSRQGKNVSPAVKEALYRKQKRTEKSAADMSDMLAKWTKIANQK